MMITSSLAKIVSKAFQNPVVVLFDFAIVRAYAVHRGVWNW